MAENPNRRLRGNRFLMYMESFKKCEKLDDAQIRELLIKAKQGDVMSTHKIIESIMPMVLHIATSRAPLHHCYTEMTDLAQEGVFGVYKAIEKFDLRRKTKFTSYAYWWIRLVMDRAYYNYAIFEGSSCSSVRSREPLPLKALIDREDVELVKTQAKLCLKSLPEREREIIALRFGLSGGEALTLQQVGDRLNISRERVRQIELRAMNRLQDCRV